MSRRGRTRASSQLIVRSKTTSFAQSERLPVGCYYGLSLRFPQINLVSVLHLSFQHSLHVFQHPLVFAFALRGYAVSRNDQMIIPEMRPNRGKQHADVASKAGENQRARAQMLQEEVEGG